MFGVALIILIPLLIIVLFGLVQLVQKKRWIFKRVNMYAVVMMYVMLGFASFCYLKLSGIPQLSKLTIEEEGALFNGQEEMVELVFSDKLDELDPARINERESVTVNTSTVRLVANNDGGVRGVIAYRDDPQSNEIVMTTFHQASSVDGYSIASLMPPVNLDYVDKQLYVTAKVLRLSIYEPRAKITKLLGEDWFNGGYYAQNGQHLVHLSVPSHIEILIDGVDFSEVE